MVYVSLSAIISVWKTPSNTQTKQKCCWQEILTSIDFMYLPKCWILNRHMYFLESKIYMGTKHHLIQGYLMPRSHRMGKNQFCPSALWDGGGRLTKTKGGVVQKAGEEQKKPHQIIYLLILKLPEAGLFWRCCLFFCIIRPALHLTKYCWIPYRIKGKLKLSHGYLLHTQYYYYSVHYK